MKSTISKSCGGGVVFWAALCLRALPSLTRPLPREKQSQARRARGQHKGRKGHCVDLCKDNRNKKSDDSKKPLIRVGRRKAPDEALSW